MADDPSSPTLLYRLALTRMKRAIELYESVQEQHSLPAIEEQIQSIYQTAVKVHKKLEKSTKG